MTLPSNACRLTRSVGSFRPFQPWIFRTTIQTRCLSQSQPRRASEPPVDEKTLEEMKEKNPLLARYHQKKAERDKKSSGQPQAQLSKSALSSTSIFNDGEAADTAEGEVEPDTHWKKRDPQIMATALDPDPAARLRLRARLLTRTMRRRNRMNKTELIRATERQSLTKSHWMRTSVKKLGMLARQIAGKPIEEAIVQMRFSKKKAAREVQDVLELARDEAIVRRGMGLGKVEGRTGTPIQFDLKDGSKHSVTDRTGIYIAQAWVGRGEYKKSVECRARGKANILMHPHTSISVILKEEATRIREAADRQKRRERKRVWVQLPDRPVTAQRQYCLW